MGVRSTKPGRRHPGLKELLPNNHGNDRLLWYRLYRFKKKLHKCLSREMGKVKDFISRIEIPVKKHLFSGEDLIKNLDFLAHFVRNANIQDTSESQMFIVILFFTGFAQS